MQWISNFPFSCYDYVRIYDDMDMGVNAKTIWQVEYCGQEIRASTKFYSKSSAIIMQFHADGHRQEIGTRGFVGRFKFLPRAQFDNDARLVENTACSYTVKSTAEHRSGRISTPNYPYYYASQTTCNWWLTARPGERVRIQITQMQLPPSSSTSDALGCADATPLVEVREADAPLRQVCRNEHAPLPSVVTAGPKAHVLFIAGDNSMRLVNGSQLLVHIGSGPRLHGRVRVHPVAAVPAAAAAHRPSRRPLAADAVHATNGLVVGDG